MRVNVDHVLGTLGAHRQNVLDEFARAQLAELGSAQNLHEEKRVWCNITQNIFTIGFTQQLGA